jgi:hypothetical protein
VHRNSVLTNNAYYCIDSKAKTFQMEKKYSFTGAVVPCPHDMEIFKPMKLSLSHFEAKDKSTPAPKFGYVHRTPAQNKKDCIFREVAVPEFYQKSGLSPPDDNHLLMKDCILSYAPPVLMYPQKLDEYQISLHDVVKFFEDVDGCYHMGQNKVLKCQFFKMEVTEVEAMCWAHLWETEGALKSNRY